MVFFNYTTMQVSAKIVYYGPGLCGKTTNLHQIHSRTDPGSRGEMVSLETEADRTLFFDLLPLEVGTIGGMRVRLQLYTVPGQVFYNTTRKLVLKGVDGIVFVADSQEPALDANIESFRNLKKNLDELNQPLGKIPFIFQYNKRDLRNILPVEALDRHLNHEGFDAFEGAALHGVGVFETLKSISKKTLAAVHRKISGNESPPVLVGLGGLIEEEAATPTSAELRSSAAPRPPAAREASGSALEPPPDPPVADDSPLPVIDALPPVDETVDSVSVQPEGSNVLFNELEDELDPDPIDITTKHESYPEAEPEGPLAVAENELGTEASTAEVKIEFAANPELTQELDSVPESPTAPRKVATKSSPDIERELAKLREMAFGTSRSREKKSKESSTTVFAQAEAIAEVPQGVLGRASGVVVDLRLVGDDASHSIAGAIKVELPPIEPGGTAKLRLEIELKEARDD